MDHCHAAPASDSTRPLAAAFGLTAVVFLAELCGGWWTGSLALMADAAHMGVDLLALGIGIFASRMSRRPPDAKRTFGYQRVEVLAALVNGGLLLVATGVILREAYERFYAPRDVRAAPMLAIAAVGLISNVISGAILYAASKSNLNLRAVFLHVASDALGSLGAIGAGAVILATGWTRADPVASGLICVIIVTNSILLVRDSVHILLEGAPSHLDLDQIRAELAALPGVVEVHDLHLWSLTRGSESLSGHLVVEKGREPAGVLDAGGAMLREKFGLSHVTLQIES